MKKAKEMTGNGIEGTSKGESQKEQLSVYRHELKYFISFTNQRILAEILKSSLTLDPNGEGRPGNQYWIRSLYFDTLENSDFYDKEIGISTRKKIRIRLYDVKQEKVKIEIKNKFEQYMLKETASLSREDAKELIQGNKDILLKQNNVTLTRLYYLMTKDYYRPSLIVDYEREAYIGPIQNIRITFDKNIRVGTVDMDIFNPNLNLQPIFDEPTMVVEVKFNHFLPTWLKDILAAFHSDRYAISKYCLGRYTLY